APDNPRVPRAGFDLGGGKEFCYLLHYAEPRFGHRSLLSLVVDDNPMPPYHERETATPPMNSRCYAVSLMPMAPQPAGVRAAGHGSRATGSRAPGGLDRHHACQHRPPPPASVSPWRARRADRDDRQILSARGHPG